MGTRYPGNEEEVRALNAYINLLRAAESLTARITKHLNEEKLTLSQFGTLEALYHLGPMSQREIGKRILKSSGNITMVVDNLEKRGMVKRERQKNDRRVLKVSLTTKGKTFIAKYFPEHVKSVVEELSVLNPAEQEEIRRLCRIVGKGNEAESED